MGGNAWLAVVMMGLGDPDELSAQIGGRAKLLGANGRIAALELLRSRGKRQLK